MNESHDDTAIICQNCATSFDATRLHAARRTCPNCGEAIEKRDPVPWTNVARIANLAEAGFLTDELVGLGIDARIHQLDDFNALSDRWTSLYLIQVPPENAEEAAAQIQRHRDDDLRNYGDNQSYPLPFSSQVMDPLFWRPVALIVLTGIASFVIGQRLSGQNAARPSASNSLPSTVNQIGRPFVTEPAPGKARHRLSFDSRQQAWSLDTDRDNDGRFDVRQQFHATGAAW
jgi:predicted RNA-binding Zn-ribbon protein involved in translation (DUF1610 family)